MNMLAAIEVFSFVQMGGSIERITNKVFLLSPANVEVGAEARAQLAQTGFFNQS